MSLKETVYKYWYDADDPEDWDGPILGEDSMGYADSPDDDYDYDCDYEVGYDPYMGCYSDDC